MICHAHASEYISAMDAEASVSAEYGRCCGMQSLSFVVSSHTFTLFSQFSTSILLLAIYPHSLHLPFSFLECYWLCIIAFFF